MSEGRGEIDRAAQRAEARIEKTAAAKESE